MANLLSKTLQSRWTFVAIVVLGLALRLVVWAVAGESLGGSVTETNGKVAVRFAGGEMFDEKWHPYHPPGLSLYLAVFYRLFGADDVVTTAAMLALYVVLSLVVYGLASVVMDRLAADLGALALLSAAPFWLFFVHANHHLSVLPLMGILDAVAISRWRDVPDGKLRVFTANG